MSESSVIELRERIDILPGKRLSGKACIANSRIAVTDILGMLDDGMSHEEICNYFPVLSEEDILACIAYQDGRSE